MADTFFQKLSVIYKDFEHWLPLQLTAEKETQTRMEEEPVSRSGAEPKPKYHKAGSKAANKSRSTKNFCDFCRKNGEVPDYYSSHQLRDACGRLECPILRAYTCKVCGATGDEAHTLSYCPVLKAVGIHPPKTALLLNNTPYNSCGKRRRH